MNHLSIYLSIYLSVRLSVYDSTALVDLGSFFSFLIDMNHWSNINFCTTQQIDVN
jgi:hypothetical protein